MINSIEIAGLFARNVKTIGNHINNALHEYLMEDMKTATKFVTV